MSDNTVKPYQGQLVAAKLDHVSPHSVRCFRFRISSAVRSCATAVAFTLMLAPCYRNVSVVPNARIKDTIDDVGDQIKEDNQNRKDQRQRHDQRHIAALNRNN